ncbi:MAG: hypothetical protein ACREDL_07015 [Bradyrhizobium sp.]
MNNELRSGDRAGKECRAGSTLRRIESGKQRPPVLSLSALEQHEREAMVCDMILRDSSQPRCSTVTHVPTASKRTSSCVD